MATTINAGLSDEEYQRQLAIENKNYEEAKKTLKIQKEQNQKDIDDFEKDPFTKQKEQSKKAKNSLKQQKKKIRENRTKSQRALNKSVLQNSKKSLVPVLTLLLTNKLSEVIAQNERIGKLVDDTNAIITDANTTQDPTKLNNAKVARDNAIKIIQSNEEKIIKINEQIQRISTYVNIFNIVVNIAGPILLSIPVPSPAPDAVTTPKENFRRRVYDPAVRLLNGLSALLPIASVALEKAVSILQDYKAQLLTINGELDAAAATGINSSLLNNNQYGITPSEYKGFKFALREENNPKFVVRGNKRSYAVAINKQNVEVLKSDLSFTLDPNDLIEQLKLVIDQQNLQA